MKTSWKWIATLSLTGVLTAWSYQGLDRQILPDCIQFKRQWKEPLELITRLGEAWIWLAPVLLALIWFRYRRPDPAAANRAQFFIFAVASAGLVNTLIKVCCGRARPSQLKEGFYGFHGFSLDSHFGSFPSGHSNTAAASALAIAILFPRLRWLMLVTAILIAASRVLLHAHYLSDALAGMMTGAIVVLAVESRWKFDARAQFSFVQGLKWSCLKNHGG